MDSWRWDPDIGGVRRAAALHIAAAVYDGSPEAARPPRAAAIVRARQAAGLSQRALADLLGLRPQTVSEVETGQAAISGLYVPADLGRRQRAGRCLMPAEQLALWTPPPPPAPPPDPHQRGVVVLPWDTAGGRRAGDVVPAWVCCRCGGVEVSAFGLSINHGCCDGGVPACVLLPPRWRPFDACWRAA